MVNTETVVAVLYSLTDEEFSILTLADVIELNRSNAFKRIESDAVVVAAASSHAEAEIEVGRFQRILDARESNFLEDYLRHSDEVAEYQNLDLGSEPYESLLDELERTLEN